MYSNASDKVHAAEAETKAYAMRDRVNERERLYIEYNYSQNVSGDLQKELEALRQWASIYPEDNLPLGASPNDTLIKAEYLPSVKAAIALREGRGADAVALLQAAEPYEMRDPTVPYLRGQALLMAHRGAEAEAEFEKIAEQPWLADPSAPLIDLAELGVARALAMQGKMAQAEAAYRKFLARWRGADAGLPLVVKAKAELQQLESVG